MISIMCKTSGDRVDKKVREIMFLAEVCIETNRVIELTQFYRQIMNIQEIDRHVDAVHQFITTEGVALTIYNDGKPKNNQNQNISIAFTVDDVDIEYERLLKLGIEVIDPPTTRPWGAKNMHFQDLDGNQIYFRSFPKVK